MKILYIEDQPVIRETVADMLRDHGHQVVAVADLLQGKRQLASPFAPHCIVLDVVLPGGTGDTWVKTVRQSGGRRSNIPVVVTTALDGGTVRDLRKEGEIVLQKPFTDEQLLCAIEEAVSRRTLETPMPSRGIP